MGSDVALFAESPLVAADDLPIHQTAETLGRPDTLHPRWTERWYFNLQHADGRLLGIVGGGFYPNSHLLEVYACLLDGPYQHNLRQRVRTSDRSRLDLGDRVAFEVTEPMRSWKVSASGPAFALQLRYEATHAPHLFPPFLVAADLPHRAGPGDYDAIQHFVQPGAVTGHVSVDRERDVGRLHSFRDRTWGVRSSRPRLHNWFVFHVPDGRYLTLIHQERADGSQMVSHGAIVAADGSRTQLVLDDHDLTFDGVSRLLRVAHYRGHDARGRRFRLAVTNTGEGVRLLGAGYASTQGDAGGGNAVESETFDLADADVVRRTGRGTIDSPASMDFEWDHGERMTGIGITESAIARDHWRYGSQLA
jgi:hypothetical protein